MRTNLSNLALILCLIAPVAAEEIETFGTGEVDQTVVMIGDRVQITYRGRTPQGKASIEEAEGTVVDVYNDSFDIEADGHVTTLFYELIIRLDRYREVFWALDPTDLQLTEGEFIAKYMGGNELTGLEGMWVWDDRSFQLVVVRDESERIKQFDYVGLVLTTTHAGWRMGEIKLFLKQTATDGAFSAVIITDKKVRFNTTVLVREERLIDGMFPQEPDGHPQERRNVLRTFPIPDDDTDEVKVVITHPRAGSGFFVSANAVVTAFDLIENADTIRIGIPGERLNASLKAHDKRNNLALLTIDAESQTTLQDLRVIPLVIGDASTSSAGDRVVATGYASDATRPSVYEGIINSLTGPDEDLTRFTVTIDALRELVGASLIDRSNRVVGIIPEIDMAGTVQIRVATKANLIQSLLKMASIKIPESGDATDTQSLDTSLIGQMARSAVVSIWAK